MLSGRHMQHKRVHDKIEPVASGICHYAWQILHHSHSIRSWYPLAANFCIIVMPYAHGTPGCTGVPGQPSIKLSFSFNQCEKVIVVSFLFFQPGVHRRAWCAVNEHCSKKGPVWSSQHCIMMEPVKQVPSRGTNLQQAFNSAATAAPVTGPAVQVDVGTVDWLQYGGKTPTALHAVQVARVILRYNDRSCSAADKSDCGVQWQIMQCSLQE